MYILGCEQYADSTYQVVDHGQPVEVDKRAGPYLGRYAASRGDFMGRCHKRCHNPKSSVQQWWRVWSTALELVGWRDGYLRSKMEGSCDTVGGRMWVDRRM